MKKIMVIWFCAILIMSATGIILPNTVNPSESHVNSPLYTTHGSIYIDGNADIWLVRLSISVEEQHITANTIWTLANSLYWVEGDVIVDNGTTLTIEPGIGMKFNESYGLYVGGNLATTIGRIKNMIKFTLNNSFPSRGDWGRIQINSTGYCNVLSVVRNLYIKILHIGWHRLDNCETKNCITWGNDTTCLCNVFRSGGFNL